jgi:hypothetical protein
MGSKMKGLLVSLVTLGIVSAKTMTVLVGCFYYNKKKQKAAVKEFFKDTTSLLLVTATPEDEVLYFLPSFESLQNHPLAVTHHLTISNGDSDGCGKLKEIELANSCRILNVEHHHVVHDPYLEDYKTSKWDGELVSKYVVEYAKEHKIQNVARNEILISRF